MLNRIAVLGDIHSNGLALDACLAAIDARGITTGVCTGDIVMRGPRPDHCVTALRERGWPCVSGNTDQKVARADDLPNKKRKLEKVGTRWWTRARLTDRNLQFITSLPMVQRLTLGGYRVAVVHGSPDDPTDAMDAETPNEALISLAHDLDADCVVSGHTHRPFVRHVESRLFVNPGSVGETRNGDLRPCWAWIEATPSGLEGHLERVDKPLAMVRDKNRKGFMLDHSLAVAGPR